MLVSYLLSKLCGCSLLLKSSENKDCWNNWKNEVNYQCWYLKSILELLKCAFWIIDYDFDEKDYYNRVDYDDKIMFSSPFLF